MAFNQKGYYSISMRCETAIKRYINIWFHLEDLERRMKFVAHISINDAFGQLLNELSTMEERFYDDFDGQKLKRLPTKDYMKDFAINEILKMQMIIYRKRSYYPVIDDDDGYSESEEQPAKDEYYTPEIVKLRIKCANKIWIEWSNDRHFGPRVGIILISTMEKGAEKVLLIQYVRNNRCNIGFPKGMPNIGETKRIGGFREFMEEIGAYDISSCFHINEDDGITIKKQPYIGPRHQRRIHTHYYTITTTSTQFSNFRHNSKEIWDAEWHSVYTLPCCDSCRIKRNSTLYKGSEIPVNYRMTTLQDINGKNSAVIDILAYIDAKNGDRDARDKYIHTHRDCRHHTIQ